MKEQDKSKAQLIHELTTLRQRFSDLEAGENERKRVEEVLPEREQHHRLLLDSSPDPSVIYDDSGRVLYVNLAFSQTFGWSENELLGKRVDFVPEVNWPETSVAIEQLFDQGKIQGFETKRLTKNRQVLDIQLSGAILTDKEGIAVGNIIFFRDITARKQAEETLQKYNEYLTVLHDITLRLTHILDLDTVIETFLDHLERLVPYDSASIMILETESRVTLKAMRGFERWADPARVQTITFDPSTTPTIHRVLTTRQSFLIPDTTSYPGWQTHSETAYIRNWLGVPLLVGEEVIGLYSIDKAEPSFFTEVQVHLAEMLAAQLAIAIANARLYGAAQQEITKRQQAEEEAEKAREAAEAASEAKGTFLVNVSHELRSPLTSVLGFTKIIRKRLHEVIFPGLKADKSGKTDRAIRQVEQNLDIIVSEGERLTNLINNVLDLAKIEAGRVEWQVQLLSVADLIERAIEATSDLFETKRLELIADIDDKLPAIIGDQDRLIQVVINLISNAVKFTDEGSVTCRAKQLNSEIVVSIIDTGIGISPANQSMIFEIFKHADDTLTDKPKGAGLGLSICREIVAYHGGRIWVQSELGQGSTLSFTLPVKAMAETE